MSQKEPSPLTREMDVTTVQDVKPSEMQKLCEPDSVDEAQILAR